jgi:hypothetical protein
VNSLIHWISLAVVCSFLASAFFDFPPSYLEEEGERSNT